jgi:hypothetical protein
MKRIILRVALVVAPLLTQITASYAQLGVNIGSTPQGINFMGEVDPKLKGSPYLFDSWAKGSVLLEDGKSYNDLALMYDVLADRVIFKSDLGKMQAFSVRVKEFTVDLEGGNQTFRSGFPAIDGGTINSYYHILTDGNTKFLKKISKQITEGIEPGDITMSKKLQNNVKYYIFIDNKLLRVKKDKKAILSLLNSKASADLENYISSNKLNLKNEDDIVKLINYYNRLA